MSYRFLCHSQPCGQSVPRWDGVDWTKQIIGSGEALLPTDKGIYLGTTRLPFDNT